MRIDAINMRISACDVQPSLWCLICRLSCCLFAVRSAVYRAACLPVFLLPWLLCGAKCFLLCRFAGIRGGNLLSWMIVILSRF